MKNNVIINYISTSSSWIRHQIFRRCKNFIIGHENFISVKETVVFHSRSNFVKIVRREPMLYKFKIPQIDSSICFPGNLLFSENYYKSGNIEEI